MKINNVTLALSLMLIFSFATLGQQNTPGNATRSFYNYDRAHGQTFNRRNIEARKGWFSASLYKLFLKEIKREAAWTKKHPDEKPFFGDGLPFQPYDETCKIGNKDAHRTFSVHQEFQRRTRGAATVTFAFPKGCTDGEKIVYTIGLVRENGKWVIDDLNYGEDTTLKQRMERSDY